MNPSFGRCILHDIIDTECISHHIETNLFIEPKRNKNTADCFSP